MAYSQALPYFRRALERWPKDALRPECQFQDVLAKRLTDAKGRVELKDANALYTLLEDRFARQVGVEDELEA